MPGSNRGFVKYPLIEHLFQVSVGSQVIQVTGDRSNFVTKRRKKNVEMPGRCCQ